MELSDKEWNKIDMIADKSFNNDYLRLLSISDHLTECKLKYEAYKLDAINKDFTKQELRYELEKELMDLLILLLIERDANCLDNLFESRLDKFLSKINSF